MPTIKQPLSTKAREQSVLTELRRDLHGAIGTMNAEECRAAIETVQNLRDRERRRAQLRATHNEREDNLLFPPINAIAEQ